MKREVREGKEEEETGRRERKTEGKEDRRKIEGR